MEGTQERKVKGGKGGDVGLGLNGGGMEAGEKAEAIVEGMLMLEVDSSSSRKTEQLYKLHERQLVEFFPEEVTLQLQTLTIINHYNYLQRKK